MILNGLWQAEELICSARTTSGFWVIVSCRVCFHAQEGANNSMVADSGSEKGPEIFPVEKPSDQMPKTKGGFRRLINFIPYSSETRRRICQSLLSLLRAPSAVGPFARSALDPTRLCCCRPVLQVKRVSGIDIAHFHLPLRWMLPGYWGCPWIAIFVS